MTTANEQTDASTPVGATDFWTQVQAIDLSAIPTTIEFYQLVDGDVVLGEVSETIRRLHVLVKSEADRYNSLIRAIKEKMLAHGEQHKGDDHDSDHDCLAFHQGLKLEVAETDKLKRRVKRMERLFWDSLRIDFPDLEGKEGIFIADGWRAGHKKQEPAVHSGILVIGEEVLGLGDSGRHESPGVDRFLRSMGFRI